jgi:hypothetical protein
LVVPQENQLEQLLGIFEPRSSQQESEPRK